MKIEGKSIIIIISTFVCGVVLGVFCFYLGTKAAPKDQVENKGDNAGVETEKENDDEIIEQVPTDSSLIIRSKDLVNNIGELLSGNYGYDTKSFHFAELKTNVYKLKDQKAFADKVTNTFLNNSVAWKYVPYYESNGIYYGAMGAGGFMGAGKFIFEYSVLYKTAKTASVKVEYVECYDETVHDTIDACQNKASGNLNTITLNLSNINGKWLISSMVAENLVNSIIK